VDGIVHNMYRSACEAFNLLENENHWDKSIEDSSATTNPFQIRTLFVIILSTCFPSQPVKLWEKYKDYMIEDILHRMCLETHNLGLYFI